MRWRREISAPGNRALWRWRRLVAAASLLMVLGAPGQAQATASAGAPLRPQDYPAPIRIACVGDSITAGYGTSSGIFRYPTVLAKLLGDDFVVGNFGVRGATLLERGERPYRNQSACIQAQNFRPDAVVIMLGTNDTRAVNWHYRNEFTGDLAALIAMFRVLPSQPRIWLGLPPPITGANAFEVRGAVLENEVLPLLRRVAATEPTGLIDIHRTFNGRPDLQPDHVHPNDAGYAMVANSVFQTLTGAPSISPGNAWFTGSIVVTLRPAAMPETIHYTLDGSTPGPRSPVYARPLLIRATTVVTACAIFPDGTQSLAVSAHLTRGTLPH